MLLVGLVDGVLINLDWQLLWALTTKLGGLAPFHDEIDSDIVEV